MARISTGQTYGPTGRKTSQRLLGGGDMPSLSGEIARGQMAPMAIQPQAAPVNTFISPGQGMQFGGPVSVPRPPGPQAPNGDMEALAKSLGSFNQTLGVIGETYVLKQKELDKSRQEEAMQFAQQATSLAGAYTGVADLQRRLEKKAGEGDAGSQRLLQYMLSRHPGMFAYLAESAQENAILMGASSLSSKMRSASTIPDGQGGELEIDSLSPDDPRLQQWIQQQVISDQVVSPRVFAKHQNMIIAAQNNAREVHEGRHVGYRVREFKADTSLKVGALANGYLSNTFNVAQVTGQMQSLLDDPRYLGLPPKEREQLIDGLWDIWKASIQLSPNAQDNPPDAEKVLAPFMNLMVGPEGQRFKADGTPNENLLLVARLGGAAWIDKASGELQTSWLQQYNRNEQVEEIGARNYANDLIEQNMSPEIMQNPDLAAAARESALQAIQSDPNMTLEQKAKASAMVDKAYTDRDEAFNSEGRRDRELNYDLQLTRAYQDPQYAVQMQRQIEEDVRLRRISDSKASSLLGSIAQFQNSNSKPFKEQLDSLITAKRNDWKLNSQAASSYDGQAVGEFETNSWARAESQMLEEGTRIVREGMAAGKPSTQINDDLANLFKSRNFGLKQRQVPVDQTQLYKTPQELIQKNRQGWASSSIPPEKAAYLKGQARVKPLVSEGPISDAMDAITKGQPLTPEMKEILRAVTTGPNRIKPSEFFIQQMKFHGIDVPPEQIQQLQKLDETFRVSSAPAGARPQVAAWQNPFLGMARNLGNTAMNTLIPPAQARGSAPPMGSGGFSGEAPASVVYERSGGQPGVDYWFPSKQFPAVLPGRVKDIGREPGYGNYVVVESTDPRNGRKVDVLYGHLPDGGTFVRKGQTVTPGQVIGRQGGTGNVRSADGTIASVDFFAPRPAGSRDMTPYSDFDGLRRHVTGQLQRGQTLASTTSRTTTAAVTTKRGGGMTGLVTYYEGGGGQDGVAGGPTANGERYNPKAMTAAVQWSLRGKYLNKWLLVEDLDTGKKVRVWANDVGPMGGDERSPNSQDPRIIDLSPAAFKGLYGSLDRGVGRIRVRIDPKQRRS